MPKNSTPVVEIQNNAATRFPETDLKQGKESFSEDDLSR